MLRWIVLSYLATQIAPIRCVSLGVKADVFIEVAGISERPQADAAFKRFVAGVRPNVYLESILPGVDLAAVKTQVAAFPPPQTRHEGLHIRHRVRRRCGGQGDTRLRGGGGCRRWQWTYRGKLSVRR